MCHAAEPSYEGIYHAPKGVMLETDAAIAEHAREIYLQAGRSHAMPPGNVTADHAGGARADRGVVRGSAAVGWRETTPARPHAHLPALARQRRRPRRLSLRGGRRRCCSRDGRIAAAGAYADVSRQGRRRREKDRPPAASAPARLHRRACAFPADAGDRLLRRGTARLAEQIHLSGGDASFVNAQHGRRIARLFLDEMVRHGTTTVAAYCSVHKESARGVFRRGA